ncbi:peptide synthetase, partial [Amycolatopsis alba DSM 44262]
GAATGDDDFACARAWSEPAPEPETVALLQYTSGSTMEPKGVMITHRNLLHNVATSRRSLGIRDDARFGGWGPLYHDMGLLGQVTPALFSGTTCVLMSPATFLKRPHLWLRMIDRFDIQVSSAPDFAYELCTRRITAEQLAGIDLSRWDIAINGSEPVRADVVEAFVEQCGPAGFRPATMTPSFGMAEATVFVTGTGEAEATLLTHRVDGAVKRFVGCGRPAAIEIRIVQPQTVIAVRDGV